MCSMTCFTWSLVFNRRSIWAHLTIFGDTMCTWRYNCANMEHQVFFGLVAAPACVTPSRDSESELPTLFGVFSHVRHHPSRLLFCIYGSIGTLGQISEPCKPWVLSILCLALHRTERETKMYSPSSIFLVVMNLHQQAKLLGRVIDTISIIITITVTITSYPS